jgi:hypothetical protein
MQNDEFYAYTARTLDLVDSAWERRCSALCILQFAFGNGE